MQSLFCGNSSEVLRAKALRDQARATIEKSSLIRRSSNGNWRAARALHIGFWPFVAEFEIAIDKHVLPREPLEQRFGQKKTRETYVALAREVRKMREEEGSHAAQWRSDAEQLGLDSLNAPRCSGVNQLIDEAYSTDHVTFFSVLAGTEFIAEELGNFLTRQRAFTRLFRGNRWLWGEIHCIHHEHGPSHLDIDLDLARAYSDSDSCESIQKIIFDTISLFGRAADEVESALA